MQETQVRSPEGGNGIPSSIDVTERARARDLEGNYPLWVCCVEITFFCFLGCITAAYDAVLVSANTVNQPYVHVYPLLLVSLSHPTPRPPPRLSQSTELSSWHDTGTSN